jgi:hypothetical protein
MSQEDPLFEAYIADVDRDHQHFKERPAIGAAKRLAFCRYY